MSLKEAMAFIQRVSCDPSLRSQLKIEPHANDLDQIITAGSRAGLDFTAEELREAFGIDWAMRWWHYAEKPKKSNSPSDESLP